VTTFFVDKDHGSASDSNPGTEGSPWATLYKMNTATIVAGDIVYTKQSASPYVMTTGGQSFEAMAYPHASGTSGNPILVSAYPGHTVTIDKQDVANPVLGAYAQSYHTIRGFTIINGGRCGVRFQGDGFGSETTGNRLERCDISGCNGSDGDNTDLVRLDNQINAYVGNCRLHGVHDTASATNNAPGVKMYNNNGTIIEHNEIYDADCGIYNKGHGVNCIHRYNYIHDVEVAAMGQGAFFVDDPSWPNPLTGNKWHNNICDTAGSHCFFTLPDGSSAVMNGLEVYNNTFYAWANFDADTSAHHLPGTLHGTGHKHYNNIYYRVNTPTRGEWFTYDDPPNCISISDYNCYKSFKIIIGVFVAGPTYTVLADWQAASVHDDHSIVQDPLFVNAAAGDFHLQGTSPCLNAGKTGGVVGGTTVHMGAYELGTETIGIEAENGGSPTTQVIKGVRLRGL